MRSYILFSALYVLTSLNVSCSQSSSCKPNTVRVVIPCLEGFQGGTFEVAVSRDGGDFLPLDPPTIEAVCPATALELRLIEYKSGQPFNVEVVAVDKDGRRYPPVRAGSSLATGCTSILATDFSGSGTSDAGSDPPSTIDAMMLSPDGGDDRACEDRTTRACSNSLGNCADGVETCVAGTWGECSVKKTEDSCVIKGDDADCDGVPNKNCPCVDGDSQSCGPAAKGICKKGQQTCVNSKWGSCDGAVNPKSRDCSSTDDNDCDGLPDNATDSACKCPIGLSRKCDEHAGDGKGPCVAGSQACVAGLNQSTSDWGACTGSVGPATADTCEAIPAGDENCNGVRNEGCPCVNGSTQPCGPSQNLGICKRGLQTCSSGAWGACIGAITANGRNCGSQLDNDCDGLPDNTQDGTCQCALNATQTCGTHPGDGKGICKAGSQSCVAGSNNASSAWAACVGSVGPAAKDTCDSGNDNNCNGTPNESCPCVNGNTQPCGPSQNVGVCKRGLQTCSSGMWGACVGAINGNGRNCGSQLDNDCDGSPDNTQDGTCQCAVNTTQTCGTHAGDGKGICKAGSQSCVAGANNASSAWATCVGSVGPAAQDACDAGNDNNCNGTPNEGCVCSNGQQGSCADKLGLMSMCAAGTTTCVAGRWGTCSQAPAAADMCVFGDDSNCDGSAVGSPGNNQCQCGGFTIPNSEAGLPNQTSYKDNGDGTVTDNVTGLVWEKAASNTRMAQGASIAFCANKAGGWRLPSVQELQTLVDIKRSNPAINMAAFPNTLNEGFWTATPLAGDASSGWAVNFGDGDSDYAAVTTASLVRCVR